jgi:Ca2+-transporting ATPase
MGIQGTDVAKEAADMVISDDSFGSIVEGIRRGRGIYANIRSVAFFYICISVWEGLIKLFIPIISDLPYFHKPDDFFYMWLLISQVIHTWPAFILGFDTISKEVMKEKPRNSQEIMSKTFVFLLITYGILLVSSILAMYFLGYLEIYKFGWLNTDLGSLSQHYIYTDATQSLWMGIDLNIAKTLTMVLCVIFVTEFVMILQIRRPNKSLLKSLKEDMNKHIIIQFILIFGVLLGLMYIPGLQVYLNNLGIKMNLMFLNPIDWLVVLFISAIPILGFEGVKKFTRKHNIVF